MGNNNNNNQVYTGYPPSLRKGLTGVPVVKKCWLKTTNLYLVNLKLQSWRGKCFPLKLGSMIADLMLTKFANFETQG